MIGKYIQRSAHCFRNGCHGISQPLDQSTDMLGTSWCHDAKLGHVTAYSVDQGDALAREKFVGAMDDPSRLLAGVLIGVVRILGRVTASQMAAASAASFLCRVT